ncbi:hypothetical protein WCE37_13535 [Luteimonas sp. MJ250]|uniref:hypothetical protein n=1 Tax=Luteimonas sp. MJ250 TaxID=3129236 RepID=UPI0031B9E9E2
MDAIILCTSHQRHFPLLSDEPILRTSNRLYPRKLYKGVLWIDKPRLVYLGMQDQYYTFNMLYAQAWLARDVILCRSALPAPEAMRADSDAWFARDPA